MKRYEFPSGNVGTIGLWFVLLWVASALASLAGMSLVIYVAWHFIQKFW